MFTMNDRIIHNEQGLKNLIQITDILDVVIHTDGLKVVVFNLDDIIYG